MRPAIRTHGRQGMRYAALVVLLPGLVVAGAWLIPTLHAAPLQAPRDSDPIITWDSSMIFPGQNSGNPWGPVGEHAHVQGSHFPDGQYKLVLAPGDVNGDANVCSPGNQIPLNASATASGGSFDATFDWPTAANQVNQQYSICALGLVDNTVASHLDSGPFTVLDADQPQITLSATAVSAGGSITVSGQNWVPEQGVQVFVVTCQSCGTAPVATIAVQSTGHNSGTFSVSLKFPANLAPGDYFVGANNSSGALSVAAQPLHVVGASISTPTPQPSPSVTASPTLAPTATTGAAGVGGSGSSGVDTGLIIGLLIGIVVVLAALAGLVAFLITRRATPPPLPDHGLPIGMYPRVPTFGAEAELSGPDDVMQGPIDPGVAVTSPRLDPEQYDAPTDPGLRAPSDRNRR
jgi:hypothetical protein